MAKKYFYITMFIAMLGGSTAFAQSGLRYNNEPRYANQSIEGLSIYPNPAVSNGKLYIESTKNEPKEVELYNVVGKKVFTTTVNNRELNLPYSVNAGIYIMKIKESNATATRKIVVK
ncbi:T9SS type A sorting domain-containing protein [Myroides odoratimimus]|nr:T9SS type A sorting domain-containing protein [Myroides odoratimimus]